MSLLHDLFTNTLDPGYQAAADSSAGAAEGGPGGGRRRPGIGLLVGLAATALLLTMAAVQARRSAPEAARTRAALVSDVQRQTDAFDRLAATTSRLQQQTSRLRRAALSSSGAGAAAAETLDRLQLATGALPVAGPGVEVDVADAAAPTPGPLEPSPSSAGAGPGQVLDRDLQRLANALWAAGAEAIAVNGQRLSALSSIRAAGDAILVNFRPVSSPYHLVAVGDPERMLTGFTASSTAAAFRTYAQAYGMHFHVAAVGHALLPAAPGLDLHSATPDGNPGTSSRPGGTP